MRRSRLVKAEVHPPKRRTGRLCLSTRCYLDLVSIARNAEGMAKTGRRREYVEAISDGYVFRGTGPTAELVAKARAYVRFRIGFHRSTRACRDVLRLRDLVSLGEKVDPLPRENRWSELAEQIPSPCQRFATMAAA